MKNRTHIMNMTRANWKEKKIAILMGGTSKEREISLRTGTAMAAALARRGHEVVSIDVRSGASLVSRLNEEKPFAAVVALHGKFGEDGCVQGLLEMLRIPYTGGGVLSSSVGMDKVICTKIARGISIPCPEETSFDADETDAETFVAGLKIQPPFIVKPSREGSTINMTIVKNKKELLPAVNKALESDTKVIVQKYIIGKEITVGLINGRSLPCLEIVPKSGFYDYTSKYTKGLTEYIVPARISENAAHRLSDMSVAIYNEIECEGTARADFIVDEKDNLFFLEINTVPGMTELSLVPKAAAHIGMDFDELCEELLSGARLKINT